MLNFMNPDLSELWRAAKSKQMASDTEAKEFLERTFCEQVSNAFSSLLNDESIRQQAANRHNLEDDWLTNANAVMVRFLGNTGSIVFQLMASFSDTEDSCQILMETLQIPEPFVLYSIKDSYFTVENRGTERRITFPYRDLQYTITPDGEQNGT